jgi:hypothetical protein
MRLSSQHLQARPHVWNPRRTGRGGRPRHSGDARTAHSRSRGRGHDADGAEDGGVRAGGAHCAGADGDASSRGVAASTEAAAAALDRFSAIHREIITLSRRNSDVRSLALSLGRKRMIVAQCDDQLRALRSVARQARGWRHPVVATTDPQTGSPPRARSGCTSATKDSVRSSCEAIRPARADAPVDRWRAAPRSP